MYPGKEGAVFEFFRVSQPHLIGANECEMIN